MNYLYKFKDVGGLYLGVIIGSIVNVLFIKIPVPVAILWAVILLITVLGSINLIIKFSGNKYKN